MAPNRETKSSRSRSSKKMSLRSMPRQIMWCSAPDPSMRDWRGIFASPRRNLYIYGRPAGLRVWGQRREQSGGGLPSAAARGWQIAVSQLVLALSRPLTPLLFSLILFHLLSCTSENLARLNGGASRYIKLSSPDPTACPMGKKTALHISNVQG